MAGNVDLRALSKVRGTAAQRKEAIEENMTLVVESGRSIGCPVEDDTAQRIIQKDPGTINNFLVDLIRVSDKLKSVHVHFAYGSDRRSFLVEYS